MFSGKEKFMMRTSRVPALAPFRIRSFRFQWPADLATSWAFEMETLILGWYVLVETGSVFLLTLFASLQHIGTLIAPMMGVMGDRIGHRNVLCAMRTVYAACATTLMIFAFTGVLTPVYALVLAAVMGLVRPSDMGMRTALVGDTMPADRLMGAMSIQRTTQDSAKIVGALTGAGLVAMLGMGPAYAVVASLYVISVVLTLKAGRARPASHPAAAVVAGNESARPRNTSAKRPQAETGAMARFPQTAVVAGNESARPSPWHDLKDGLAYVWNTPFLLAVMCLAFLLNLTAFPMMNGLLPYVAKEVYHADQTWLGYMVAGAASGALLGSIVMSRHGGAIRAGRMTIVFCAAWYSMLMVFAQLQHPVGGIVVLMLAGCAHSVAQIPMVTMLLRNSDEQFRGRIMGIRMLAIYGNVPGLLIAGVLIARFGYQSTATLYCLMGLACILLIAVRWRAQLWQRDAPANTR
jgi:MFS family permease